MLNTILLIYFIVSKDGPEKAYYKEQMFLQRVSVTSMYEWNILELDEKQQTINQSFQYVSALIKL